MEFHEAKRVRFAPSPNGYLHLGHAYSAMLNWQYAKNYDAEFLLRIEDIDISRSRPEFVKAIESDLEWLGLAWPKPVMLQSERFEIYRDAVQALKDDELIYPAFLSRKEIAQTVEQFEANGNSWPRDPDGSPHYPEFCKRLSQAERAKRLSDGIPHTWRLDMSAALAHINADVSWLEKTADNKFDRINHDPSDWGDVILARRDIPTSYHLSVVVDDAAQDIDFVIRGKDLYQSTAIHRVLQKLLDLPEPHYFHHDLIMENEMDKLSKSKGSQSLKDLREKIGLKRADVFELIHLSQDEFSSQR